MHKSGFTMVAGT